MNCQVSHFVAHVDEKQQITYYDYYLCNTHHCSCGAAGCVAAQPPLQPTADHASSGSQTDTVAPVGGGG